jgi:hypothetical protein
MGIKDVTKELRIINELMNTDVIAASNRLTQLTNNMLTFVDGHTGIDLDYATEADAIANSVANGGAANGGAASKLKRKKITEVERIDNLLKRLAVIPINLDYVLIEYQMKQNTTSPAIYYALVTYYLSKGKNTISVSAGKKNKLTYDLSNADFREKYSQKYYANKMHSVHNLDYVCNAVGNELAIGDFLVNAKCKRDFADAFNQIFGWINF